MGRSTTSCFKIISCVGSDESVDKDDNLHLSSQNKAPGQRGWSFRKRSARHRVLSNTAVTETPPSDNKASTEPITISSEPPVISEKASENQWTEEIPKLPNSIAKDATVSTTKTDAAPEDDIKCEPVPDDLAMTEEDDIKFESIPADEPATATTTTTTEPACEEDVECEAIDESAILVIQAAVRRFSAQRQLVMHKNVVKLQAAVRGHLVRKHAVGTLRCVQAIVKMQTLVRARHAKLSAIGEKVVQNPGISSQPTYVSMEKLLSNSLARQLLETTPRTKQINIKCDPSKSDSAWNWLERWMAVSSPETVEPHAPEPDQDQAETETVAPHCEITDPKSDVGEALVLSERKDDPIDVEQNSHEEETPQPAKTSLPDLTETPQLENTLTEKPDVPMHSDTEVQIEASSIPEKPVSETEPKRAAKRLATDQADSEGRKSVFGSRKASNPAFIAAQSRFEELTSKTNPSKPASSNQDSEAGKSDVGSAPESTTPITDVEAEEYLVPRSSRIVPNGGSECGTELSITSTLDSPDQSEVESKKLEEEPKVVDEAIRDTDSNNNVDIEAQKHDHGEDADDAETEKPKPANDVTIPESEQKLDDSASEADIELEPESGNQVYKSNVPMEVEVEKETAAEASPRSHITVPESQGTPSSQISKKSKKSPSQKRKSWSSSKKSPSVESGVRSSLEQLPKDPKPGKRRNSFGSPRPEHVDHESSGNSSLPSYMQATESARAKAVANGSPRSSPDVQDKEVFLKKRHSLPGAVAGNGRQGSPRIQRSMSQALQATKGNGNQERKWQR